MFIIPIINSTNFTVILFLFVRIQRLIFHIKLQKPKFIEFHCSTIYFIRLKEFFLCETIKPIRYSVQLLVRGMKGINLNSQCIIVYRRFVKVVIRNTSNKTYIVKYKIGIFPKLNLNQ